MSEEFPPIAVDWPMFATLAEDLAGKICDDFTPWMQEFRRRETSRWHASPPRVRPRRDRGLWTQPVPEDVMPVGAVVRVARVTGRAVHPSHKARLCRYMARVAEADGPHRLLVPLGAPDTHHPPAQWSYRFPVSIIDKGEIGSGDDDPAKLKMPKS